MDLETQVKILAKGSSSSEKMQEPLQVSLFEAVRRWTNEEGLGAFEIEADGKNLSSEQVQEIAHSTEYSIRLLAFDERR